MPDALFPAAQPVRDPTARLWSHPAPAAWRRLVEQRPPAPRQHPA